jgi:hypothetical protein
VGRAGRWSAAPRNGTTVGCQASHPVPSCLASRAATFQWFFSDVPLDSFARWPGP